MNSFILSLSLVLFVAITTHAAEPTDEKRLDQVAKRGTYVMPFDLKKTTHVFSKTAHIHGEDMPGLAKLKTANPGQIKVESTWLPDGVQINYSTKLPQFIKAIHQWFDIRGAYAGADVRERHDMHGRLTGRQFLISAGSLLLAQPIEYTAN